MSRTINRIIVHCSATPPEADIGFAEINLWHEKRGFKSPSGIHCGYHYIIRRDGRREKGRPEYEQGAHVSRHNHDSIGICLVGGVDKSGQAEDNFTKDQKDELMLLIHEIKQSYENDLSLPNQSKITVHGHREFSAKACPSFDVKEYMKSYVVG